MPKDLTDNPALFPTPVSVPIDGELATGAAFEAPYQQLSNRTAYLRDQMEQKGVRRVRRAADFAALRAIADMQVFDVRWVTGYGLYWYDASAVGAEELPWTVWPSTGVGLWRHLESAMRTQIGRAYLVQNFFLPPLYTVNSTWTDSGLAVTLRDAFVGERVRIHLSGDFRAEGTHGLYRVVLTDGAGVATEVPEMLFGSFTGEGTRSRTLGALHVVANAGDLVVKVQFRTLGPSANVQIIGPALLLAELVRP